MALYRVSGAFHQLPDRTLGTQMFIPPFLVRERLHKEDAISCLTVGQRPEQKKSSSSVGLSPVFPLVEVFKRVPLHVQDVHLCARLGLVEPKDRR